MTDLSKRWTYVANLRRFPYRSNSRPAAYHQVGHIPLQSSTQDAALDPSMLIGFLCENEPDCIDLRQRVVEVYAFSVCYSSRASSCSISCSGITRRYSQLLMNRKAKKSRMTTFSMQAKALSSTTGPPRAQHPEADKVRAILRMIP